MGAKIGTRMVLLIALIFSVWLMWHTFSFDSNTSTMKISDKVWSDFAGHLPLIRSFSKGQNWPPENPLFPGEKIRYHFLFFLLAGILEKLGMRIDLAVNIPSVLGFWGLLVMAYLWSKKIYKSTVAGALAIILFLFNGSMSFLTYFSKNGLSFESIKNIITTSQYPNFGPWDGGKIAAIWNLNLYTNQRHLAPGIALALLVIFLVQFRKINPLILGTIIGLLIFLNEAVFAGLAVFLVWYFIFHPKDFKYLFFTGLFVLPWFLVSRLLINSTTQIFFRPGFLMTDPLTMANFIRYWWANLGLYLLLFPIYVLTTPKEYRYLFAPIIVLFGIVNIFQLSPDMFNNHKLLNLDMAFLVVFMAGLIVYLWRYKALRYVLPVLFVGLTLSGIIDFFATKNSHVVSLVDTPKNPDIVFVQEHIPSRAVVLNSTWLNHPASLAGRPIYNGYTYFTWSHGYDSYGREAILKAIYEAKTKQSACILLQDNKISFVELNDQPEDYLHPNFSLWKSDFFDIYSNPESGVTFYDVEKSCN